MKEPTKHQTRVLDQHAIVPPGPMTYAAECKVCGVIKTEYDRSDAAGIARRHTNWWQEHGGE